MARIKTKKADMLISGPTEEVKKEKSKYTEQDFTDLALLTDGTVDQLKEEFFLYHTRKFMSSVVKVVTRYAVSDFELEKIFVDADKLGSYFDIQDGVLTRYVGNDNDLIIPKGVTEVSGYPFGSEKEFETIVIPSTLVNISASMFARCKVKEINVSKDNPKYYTQNGCLVDKETRELVWAYAANTIPCDDSIHKIGSQAFYGHKDLEHIEIPDNIIEVGSHAFAHCSNLKTVTFSNASCIIGEGCFSDCTLLSMVKLPELLNEIRRNTFAECKALETLDIPDAVERVERDAWGWGKCEDLKKINIPDDLIASLQNNNYTRVVRIGGEWQIDETSKPRNFEGFSF